MANESLEKNLKMAASEKAYLNSMMPEMEGEGYSCVSGCTSCASCGGNDYLPRKK